MEYPWYEIKKNSSEITQGDIIKNCPVPILKELDITEENQNVKAEISFIDGIILTQACDIANKKVENIILCAITSKHDYEDIMHKNGKTEKEIKHNLESIIKGQQNAYHIINEFKSDDFSQDFYIINFKDIFSVPIDIVKKLAYKNGTRLSLCPPYREHLSQAFARYFMRVGLPINISI
jgi:hypothetical protein